MSTTNLPPHYTWPILTDATRERVLHQLDESISIYGRSGVIAELEDSFCRYFGCKHAVLTSSGTAALWSLYVGANLGPGDEVICPAYTFFATVTPLFFTGAVPVLCDCDASGNIDPLDIERHITARTKAVMITHVWGMPCAMTAIRAITRKYNLLLLEDCSHAHGARFQGQLLGTFGDAAAFSLQGQKLVAAGEGGIILTNSDEIYYRALLLGHYNRRCYDEIPETHPLAPYAMTGMGMKLRIHPLAAAIASEQFTHLDEWIARKNRYAQLLHELLADIPGLRLPAVPPDVLPAWYAYILEYTPPTPDHPTIDTVYQRIIASGCTALDRFASTCPLHLLPLFQDPSPIFPLYRDSTVRYRPGDFPQSEALYARSLKLPIWCMENDEALVSFYGRTIRQVLTT